MANAVLEFLKLREREWLSPVELKFVGIAVFVELFKRKRKGFDHLFYRSVVRVNKLTFVRVAFIGRVLINENAHLLPVSHEHEVEFFRVAIPLQRVFVPTRIWVSQGGENVHKVRQSRLVRGMRGRCVKFVHTILKPYRHPAALRAVEAYFKSSPHKQIMVTCIQMFNNCRPFALCFCMAVVLAGIIQIEAQSKRPTVPKAKAAAAVKKQVERVHFLVMISTDKSVAMSSKDTGLEKQGLALTGLDKILREDLSTKDKLGVALEPTILVMPAPSIDIATLAQVTGSLRISKDTEIRVDLPDGPMLHVPRNPKFTKSRDIKPNPLTLIAVLDRNGMVSLNNEDQKDFAALTSLLTEIFKAREDNGVFRDGSNDIEKTVFLKIHPTKVVADLQKFAAAVDAGGAMPIGLQVDDL